MIKQFRSVCYILVSLSFVGCSNNLNIQAPYKNITVVYGLMDQSDSAHYIRVNRAYEGIGNAYQIAKNFDSVYYPANQITVQLQQIDPIYGPGLPITLTPDSTIPLPAGVFPSPKQILYKTKAALNPNDQYILLVTNEKTHQQLTGSTYLLPDVSFGNLQYLSNFGINWSPTGSSVIQWQATQAVIYQMTFRFYYKEKSSSGSSEKYVDWVFPTQTALNEQGISMQYNYSGYELLNILKTYIPVNDSVTRTADSLSLRFTSGSNDLNTYIQLSQPSLGIDQDLPTFSDVKNGIGIYTARHLQILTKPISVGQADSISTNPITAPLNFNP